MIFSLELETPWVAIKGIQKEKKWGAKKEKKKKKKKKKKNTAKNRSFMKNCSVKMTLKPLFYQLSVVMTMVPPLLRLLIRGSLQIKKIITNALLVLYFTK